MKLLFILNILLLIIYTKEDKISVTITATSGIINKVKYSRKKILSFIIPCQVDKNITNSISREDITFKTKRPEDDKQFEVTCNLNSVRIDSDDNYANTYLSCQLNYSTDYINDKIDDDMNLVIDKSYTPQYTSNIVEFNFQKFEEIGQAIEISGLYIFNSDNDNCYNNYYHFKMNYNVFTNKPLESTVCYIALSNNEVHDTARCAIPINTDTKNYDIICTIDISEEKMEKGEKIEISKQSLVNCENGQILDIKDNALNILEIDEDCDKSFLLIFNKFYLFILFLILF